MARVSRQVPRNFSTLARWPVTIDVPNLPHPRFSSSPAKLPLANAAIFTPFIRRSFVGLSIAIAVERSSWDEKKNEQHWRPPVRSYRPWIIGKLYLPSGTRAEAKASAKMVPKTRFNIYAARKDRLEFIPLRRGLGTSSRYLAEYFL